MKYYLDSKTYKTKNAFTLVELLVSISIIAFLAAMSITAYPQFSEQMTVSGEAYRMLAYLRETQTFGTSAYTTPGTKILYGFLIDTDDDTIKRVQILNPNDKTNHYYIHDSEEDTTMEMLAIKKYYEISSVNGIGSNSTTSLRYAYAFFKRPNPEARLTGKYGQGQGSIGPDTNTGSYDRIEVTLRSKRNNQLTKKIVILETGQMYVADW